MDEVEQPDLAKMRETLQGPTSKPRLRTNPIKEKRRTAALEKALKALGGGAGAEDLDKALEGL